MVQEEREVVVELTMLTDAKKGTVRSKKAYDLLLVDKDGMDNAPTIKKVVVKEE